MTEPIDPTSASEPLTGKYREIKHNVNNSLGVMMAMAELAQMNPENAPRLAAVVLERGPQIVKQLQEFGVLLQKAHETKSE